MSADDKAELLALWLSSPKATMSELAKKLTKSTGRTFSAKKVKQELEQWGVDQVSEKKKTELLSREA